MNLQSKPNDWIKEIPVDMAEATAQIRYQTMQNRPLLTNFRLSGDPPEFDAMKNVVRALNDKLNTAENIASSDDQRAALNRVQQLEQN